MDSLFLLSVFYGIVLLIYIVFSTRIVMRKGCIEIIDVVNFMYSFVYGFFPMLAFFMESNGESNFEYYDFSDAGIFNLYMLFFFSICGFVIINYTYGIFKKQYVVRQESRGFSYRIVLICGLISLIIGWGGLLIWTNAYGSLNEFILHAGAIRSGRDTIYNPYAFMQHFAQFVEMAFLAFVTVLIGDKSLTSGKRFLTTLLFLLSLIGFYFYVMATDSRVQIAYIGVATLLIYLRYTSNIRRSLILFVLMSFALLVLIMHVEPIMIFIRRGDWIAPEFSILDKLIVEFRFTQSAQMASFKLWFEGTLHLKLFDDLIIALTSWVPRRFVPFDIPLSVWDYNTLNVVGVLGLGQSPSDFLATSIYDMGLLGVVILPFMFGYFIAIADNSLSKHSYSAQANVYYGACVAMFMHKISHFSLASFMRIGFLIFGYFLISRFVLHIELFKRYKIKF